VRLGFGVLSSNFVFEVLDYGEEDVLRSPAVSTAFGDGGASKRVASPGVGKEQCEADR
jgi:hypothetical protein